MLPFTVRFRPGAPVSEQLIFAVRRAIAAGQLQPGDPFPSVRVLSQELRINPNTAHKAVAALVTDGLLEVRTGVGTAVASAPPPTRSEKQQLLGDDVERLVIDAKMLALELNDVLGAVEAHWRRFHGGRS